MNDPVMTPACNLERRTRLGAWWAFVLFNIVFRDLHDLFLPGKIAQMLRESPDELVLLGGSIAAELPIVGLAVACLAPPRIARMISVVLPFGVGLGVLAYGFRDADDYVFVAAELVGLAFIVNTAWRWRIIAIAGRS